MIQRFTGYRRHLSKLVDAGKVSHSSDQRNDDHEPQYQGVIWSDGSCTLRWLTAVNSTSVFASFEDMIKIHGHPEYGTEIFFHDAEPPQSWFNTLAAYGKSLEAQSNGQLVFDEIRNENGAIVAMYVEHADRSGVHTVLYNKELPL